METFEDIALRHTARGMNILRKKLEPDFISDAAARILELERGNVMITTGFYVGGSAETDGPCGALSVAKTLKALGFFPIILTDQNCMGIFEDEGIAAVYADFDSTRDDYMKIWESLSPECLISIERCGRNIEGDYANCHGNSISRFTAPVDYLFDIAAERGVLTVGVGDGGNEIGMGNLADTIKNDLGLVPCAVTCDCLIVATTSNWGAYALSAALEKQSGRPCMPDGETIGRFLAKIVTMGYTDGVSGLPEFKVDGFSGRYEMQIVDELKALASK